MRVLLAIFLFAVAAFCSFGFLATFEPVEHALVWRIGYGTVTLACLYGAWRLLR
jgi:hypothetical protein